MPNEDEKINPRSETEPEKQQSGAGDLEIVSEDLENLPPEVKRVVEASLSIQRFSSGSFSPIQQKITEQHISKILENVEKDDERAFADAQSARKYALIYTIILVISFGFLTVFLVNKDVALYQDFFKIIIIFGGGFGSGFGFKSYRDRKGK
ncbi:MAG: hypothetical protein SXA11_03180 [Cyanobacteriota bacterium]|nr:hypothetical protein [Cyanobacteriota bacterium]